MKGLQKFIAKQSAKDPMFAKGVSSERKRIIELLLETPEGRDVIELALHPSDEGSSLIALIKGDVTERLQNEMSPNGYTEGENK